MPMCKRSMLFHFGPGIAILFFIASDARGQLLINGNFESVSGSAFDQGYLPSNFVQCGNVSPGADTYSVDGSYGIPPGGYGNFFEAPAADGIRFVAGADFANGII